MSFITKNRDTMFKDERNKITLNKDMFAFASTFNDEYFANDLNWKKVAIHFKHTTSNQKKIVVMMNESSEGWFEASEMARTGTWEVEQIQVFDKDGDMTSVPRSDMPAPATFDVVTARKIAPAELVVSLQSAPQKIVVAPGKTTGYEVGFKVKLWDETLLNYLNPIVYTITNVDHGIAGSGSVLFTGRIQAFSPYLAIEEDAITSSLLQPGDKVTFMHNGTERELTLVAYQGAVGMGSGNPYSYYTVSPGLPVDFPNATNVQATVVRGIPATNGVITLDQEFTGYEGKTLRLKFPNFVDASPRQKGIYQFVGSTF